jgi:type IV pilus assembly protein PilB
MALTEQQLIDAAARADLVESAVVEKLRIKARRERVSLINVVLAHYRIPQSALYRAVAEDRKIQFVNINFADPIADLIKKIPQSLIRRKLVLPIQQQDDPSQQFLVVADPDDRANIDSVIRMLGQPLTVVMSDPQSLQHKINKTLSSPTQAEATPEQDVDLIALLDSIIKEAYLSRASDLHLVTEELGLRVRLRVDGRLKDLPINADSETAAGLISRVKVLAGLDIAEQRQPQDGGFSYELAAPINQEFNIRVATAPVRLGERITMRLLGQESGGLTLTDLGMLEQDLKNFNNAIRTPYGMILLTGPTGSGKSTTLFAALQEINSSELNIMTVENPIEYVMDGISQIQTGHKISFADALRSLLRHDPDVLMVGEIRDHETADVAIKAAMTGHLVFSTLHTNNAVSAITRLADIGCEPFLIGSTMTAVIAQRLVRRLCKQCRQQRPATEKELRYLNNDQQIEVYDAVGCAVCQGTGFSGRIGLFETLWFDETLSRLVAKGADEETIEQAAANNLQFMWQDGINKVLNGMTTLDEVLKVAVPKIVDKRDVA